MPYLSARALDGLKSYKYKAAGYTALDHLHQPFWNWLVNTLPLWFAPNAITLSGFSFIIAAYLINGWYQPDFSGQSPSWVYLFNGLAVVIYTQLDCVDGKQARRTGSSSPLGQLFDHGCDSLGVHMLLACIACSLGLPASVVYSIGTIGVMVTFIAGHWEEYHTGNMMYGNGWYGVLEANYAIATIHFATWLFGPGIWKVPLTSFLGRFLPAQLPLSYLEGFNTGEGLVMGMVVMSMTMMASNIWRVFFLNNTKHLEAPDQGHKQVGRPAAFMHLMILCMMLALGSIWLLDIPDHKLQYRLVQSCFGVVYGLTSSQLIMAHMAKEPFEPSLWAFTSLALGAVNSHVRIIDPLLTAVVVFVLVWVGYLRYVVGVIQEICNYLDIHCLRIKKLDPLKPLAKQS